jgi:hypothetical protein
MTATIIPYPLVRRRVYIARQAEHMTCLMRTPQLATSAIN